MKKMIYGAAAALLLATTGCTGSFRVMQAVHRWHTNFEERWTDEGCYLLACIFQVYSAAYVVDTIFFNSVEFWMGTNPIPETETAMITRVDASTALVTSKATGEVYTLTRVADGTFAMTDAQGNTTTAEVQGSLLTMTLPDGSTRVAMM